jgi:CheY-like chemotaxis protein
VVRRIDLQQLINGMSGLLTQSVGPSVHVSIDVDPEARYVISDANQLELALLNLAVNSRDAMNGAGAIKIEARPATDVDRTLPRGDYVDICVSDTGAGMTADVCARAIEPFFTTKPTGAGTGLGLSQVYGVMRESGGSLSLQSEVGLGTTVKLTLRRGSPEEAPLTRPSRVAIEAPNDEAELPSAELLVVDDDRLVRRFMVESLRGMGHQVKDAAEGATALELLDQQRFDLLLVDYAMPGMNGAEVARAALAKQPGIRILVVSGYADSAALTAAIGSATQLRKPFDLAELRAAVTQILTTEPSATVLNDNA